MTRGVHRRGDAGLVGSEEQWPDSRDAIAPRVGDGERGLHVTTAAAARDHQTFTRRTGRGTSGVVVDDGRGQGLGHHGRRYHTTTAPERATVVVLGDLGRSPRTLYHAHALADAGVDVDLVGYLESPLDATTAQHTRIRVHALAAPARAVPRALFVAHGLWRVVTQAVSLRRLLRRLPRPDLILVQNPPAVPTLLVAGRVARARGARLVIDWHNFGYAMLAQRLTPRHPVVRLARAYERATAGAADHHLCVSDAMRTVLAERLDVRDAVVLHDRPAARFTPADGARRAALRARFAPSLALPALDRPAALIVVPTGWTADEDVDLLLDAAVAYDTALARDGDGHPDLILVLTGDGPLRVQLLQRIDRLTLRHVHLRAHWLEPDDYPDFLATADLGVSVHRSTSGCDLPMKIADLHGAGIPVCALDYGPCLAEMLQRNEESLRFTTAGELSGVLLRLLAGFPHATRELDDARAAVVGAPRLSWREGWQASVAPILLRRAAHAHEPAS
jgi:beta-1,4-mannosyltransferase